MAHTFTDEERSKGGLAGSAAQRQKREERDRRSLVVWEIVEEADLSPVVLAQAMAVVKALQTDGELPPVESWLDAQRAANVAEVLHRIHRLASNQSTSNVAHATMTEEERQERMARLAHVAAGAQGEASPSPTE